MSLAGQITDACTTMFFKEQGGPAQKVDVACLPT
jgi:hypothetical protein